MKKIIFPILLFLFVACASEITKIEYSTTTMMGRTVVAVTSDSVIVTFSGRGEPTRYARATEDLEWKNLLESINEVDLNGISDLQDTSQDRFVDAAPSATFIITTKDSTYTSATFDGNKPNAVLRPLMDEMNKVIKKNQP